MAGWSASQTGRCGGTNSIPAEFKTFFLEELRFSNNTFWIKFWIKFFWIKFSFNGVRSPYLFFGRDAHACNQEITTSFDSLILL